MGNVQLTSCRKLWSIKGDGEGQELFVSDEKCFCCKSQPLKQGGDSRRAAYCSLAELLNTERRNTFRCCHWMLVLPCFESKWDQNSWRTDIDYTKSHVFVKLSFENREEKKHSQPKSFKRPQNLLKNSNPISHNPHLKQTLNSPCQIENVLDGMRVGYLFCLFLGVFLSNQELSFSFFFILFTVSWHTRKKQLLGSKQASNRKHRKASFEYPTRTWDKQSPLDCHQWHEN